MTELVHELNIMNYLLAHGDVMKEEFKSYLNIVKMMGFPTTTEEAELLHFFISELSHRLNLSYLDVATIVTPQYLKDILWTN